MAVAHSSASESHTGSTGSTNQTSFSWTHTQTGTPQGVLVFVHTISASDFITSVTYGSVTLARVAGAVAIDATGEPGRTDLFFAGSGLASGNQTITVTRTNNATIMYASAATVTAGADVNVTGIQVQEDNQALSPVSIDDGSSGINSLRYAATYYGANSPAPAGTGSTLLTSIDLGSFGNSMVRETTAGQGARNVGFNASTDDVATVYVAVREVTAWSITGNTGSFTLTGNDVVFTVATPAALSTERANFVFTGNAANFARNYPITIDAGGYTLTGNNAGLSKPQILSAESGTFALAGNAPTLREVYIFSITAGSFSFSGNDATLSKTTLVVLSPETGGFTTSGNTANFSHTYRIETEIVALSIAGNGILFNYSKSITTATSSFSWAGNLAVLSHKHVADPDSAAFAVSGNATSLVSTKLLRITHSNYSVIGNAATPLKNWRLAAETASFVLAPQAAQIGVGSKLLPEYGLFALTGKTTSLQRTWNLSVESGSIDLIGKPTALTETGAYEIDITTTSFVLTGKAFKGSKAWKITTHAAEYGLSGGAISFTVPIQPVVLQSLDLVYQAQPFFYVEAQPLQTTALDLVYQAQPFVASKPHAYELAPVTASYELLNKPASFKKGQALLAQTGIVDLIGNNITLSKISSIPLDIETGSFVSTGNNATLYKSTVVYAEDVNLAVDTRDVQFKRTYTCAPSSGVFVVNGSDSTVLTNRYLFPFVNNFSVTRSNAYLVKGKVLTAEPAPVALVGNTAIIQYYRISEIDKLNYNLSFIPATLQEINAYSIDPEACAFTFTGNTTDLTRTRYRRKQVLIF